MGKRNYEFFKWGKVYVVKVVLLFFSNFDVLVYYENSLEGYVFNLGLYIWF